MWREVGLKDHNNIAISERYVNIHKYKIERTFNQ